MLTESSVSLLTGTFPGLLNCRGGQVVLFNVFSLLRQAQAAILHSPEVPVSYLLTGLFQVLIV